MLRYGFENNPFLGNPDDVGGGMETLGAVRVMNDESRASPTFAHNAVEWVEQMRDGVKDKRGAVV